MSKSAKSVLSNKNVGQILSVENLYEISLNKNDVRIENVEKHNDLFVKRKNVGVIKKCQKDLFVEQKMSGGLSVSKN